MSYEATATSATALRDSLAEALACLPLIDTGNKMVDKCAKFAATLNYSLNLLGKSLAHSPASLGPIVATDANGASRRTPRGPPGRDQ